MHGYINVRYTNYTKANGDSRKKNAKGKDSLDSKNVGMTY